MIFYSMKSGRTELKKLEVENEEEEEEKSYLSGRKKSLDDLCQNEENQKGNNQINQQKEGFETDKIKNLSKVDDWLVGQDIRSLDNGLNVRVVLEKSRVLTVFNYFDIDPSGSFKTVDEAS